MFFIEKKRNAVSRDDLFEALLRGDVEQFEELLGDWLDESISYYDGKELYYHGFLSGLLSGFRGYTVKFNRESGLGRPDILILERRRHKLAVIVEIKVAERFADTADTIGLMANAGIKSTQTGTSLHFIMTVLSGDVLVMNEQVSNHLEKFPAETVDLFDGIRDIIFDTDSAKPQEILWAKLPSYYVGNAFVRIIAFKDRINIEAKAIAKHKDELSGYKITPKGMLQIFVGQEIPIDILKQVFAETLA